MKFPLADWIDAHPDCRHDLAQSGMRGVLHRPAFDRGRTPPADTGELREALAREVGVASDRLFLTHGATESNAWVTFYLARTLTASRPRSCRVRLPEYPPLFDGPTAAGFCVAHDRRPAELAVVSRPRNPEGTLWPETALLEWADGARHLLVDETFREFADVPSVAGLDRRGVWTTGSFTKFFGADHLRVGFLTAPAEEAEPFGRFLGLVADELPDRSVSAAIALLRGVKSVRSEVQSVLTVNRAAYLRRFPREAAPRAPVCFDRGARDDGGAVAERCLRASILVCPGSFFGDPRGVRLCLTRRTFPADLDAYLAARDAGEPVSVAGQRSDARPHRGEGARGRVARG